MLSRAEQIVTAAHRDFTTSERGSLAEKPVSLTYVTKPSAKKWAWLGIFKPAEPHSPWDLGHRITAVTKERQSLSFLWQRLSIAVQRGNAACITVTQLTDTEQTDRTDSDRI